MSSSHISRVTTRYFSSASNAFWPSRPPEFPRYRAEEDPEWLAWTGLPTPQLLVRISSMRAKLMARLRSLTDEDFERTGVHPRFGAMSLSLWLEFFLVHEAHHLYVVLQLAREKS